MSHAQLRIIFVLAFAIAGDAAFQAFTSLVDSPLMAALYGAPVWGAMGVVFWMALDTFANWERVEKELEDELHED